MEFQTLTVHHYAENPADERRVTISPAVIAALVALPEDTVINGRSIRHLTVLFLEGGSIDLNVNHSDLSILESAVGAYSLA